MPADFWLAEKLSGEIIAKHRGNILSTEKINYNIIYLPSVLSDIVNSYSPIYKFIFSIANEEVKEGVGIRHDNCIEVRGKTSKISFDSRKQEKWISYTTAFLAGN